MRQHQSPSTTGFEDRLLGELRALVAERGAAASEAEAPTGPRRRGPRLALSTAAVTAAAVAALIVSAGGGDTPAAFAVEPQPEGRIDVEIRSLEDPRELEQALDEAGIPSTVNYLATGMVCREPRFRVAPWPGWTGAFITGPGNGEGPFVFSIGRGAVGPGQSLVITASPGSNVLLGATQVKIAEGSVAPCEPVPAPANSGD